MKSFSPRVLLPVYGIGVLGAFLQIAAAQWDVSAHILGIVETFFTPAHSVLYAGIGLVALANLQGLRLRLAYSDSNPQYSSLFTGLRIAILGTLLQLVAGPIDFYWHITRGFDPYLFTPPHSILIVGVLASGVGMALGATRLLQAQRLGIEITSRRWLLALIVIVGLTAMWGQFNFAGYWVTDLRGMAWTFGICNVDQFYQQSCGFVNAFDLASSLIASAIFGATGTVFFWMSKKLFGRRGAATLTSTILSAVYAVLALGFLAYGLVFLNPPGSFYMQNPAPERGVALASTLIPLYLLASILPVFILDIGFPRWLSQRNLVMASGLVGPLEALLDGRYVLGLAQSSLEYAVAAQVSAITGGVLGALVLVRIAARVPLGVASTGKISTNPEIPTSSARKT